MKMLSPKEIFQMLQNYPQGYLKPDHILFKSGNSNLLHAYEKLGVINSHKDETPSDTLSDSANQIFCNAFSCGMVFGDISSYQSHYNVMHRFICAECKKSVPTEHLLDLHISEHHDSYFKTRIERGESMFKCYLEECETVFESSHGRKEHCIKQHKFPSNFRFDQFAHKNASKKRSEAVKMEVDELKPNFKNLEFKFSFGHQKDKPFCPKSRHKQKRDGGKTLENMNTLKQVLETM